jgi:hypothetical protein
MFRTPSQKCRNYDAIVNRELSEASARFLDSPAISAEIRLHMDHFPAIAAAAESVTNETTGHVMTHAIRHPLWS